MESKKISQLATELTPSLSDLTIIGDPTTGISKKITLSQMASLFTGTVEEYANLAAFPLVGVADTIYIALDTNIIYRWDTSLSTYVVLSPNIINSLVFSDANGFDGTITLVGSVATLSITTALTLGSVPFIGASGALSQDNANLFFDDTNNRLGINTNAPTTALDVFGSGIIGRINGTSTNNAYLGFASAGTNKWSVGNVQSDHRFRIFSEANSAELFTVLQTGEIGIGIANPTTKFHIDGAASALIANLDANVSVAKSISFRSDNSNRINLEVSGTESGSNAGADFFLRTYTDAGSLLATPLTIVRSTSAATFVSSVTASALIPTGSSVPTNGMYLSAANTLNFATNSTNRVTIASTGAATFGDYIEATSFFANAGGSLFLQSASDALTIRQNSTSNNLTIKFNRSGTNLWGIQTLPNGANEDFRIFNYQNSTSPFTIASTGLTTFSAFGTHSFSSGGTGYNKLGIRNTTAGAANGAQLSIGTNADPDQFYVQSFATTFTTSGMNIAGGAVVNGEGPGGLSLAATQSNIGFYTNGAGAANLRMFINTSGNIGIGTSSPDQKLTISAAGTNGIISFKDSAGVTQNFIGQGNATGDIIATSQTNDLCFRTQGGNMLFALSNIEFARFTSGGSLGLGVNPSYKLQLSSDSAAKPSTALWTIASDIRIKENINPYKKGLQELLKINPITYDYNGLGGFIKGKGGVGIIAQEIIVILPDSVSSVKGKLNETDKDETDILNFNGHELIYVLINSIKEQQVQIEELKELINK